MICPHGNRSDEIDPSTMCAQCEAAAEARPIVLAHVLDLAELEVGHVFQDQLPGELLPRPLGSLPL